MIFHKPYLSTKCRPRTFYQRWQIPEMFNPPKLIAVLILDDQLTERGASPQVWFMAIFTAQRDDQIVQRRSVTILQLLPIGHVDIVVDMAEQNMGWQEMITYLIRAKPQAIWLGSWRASERATAREQSVQLFA